MEPDREERDDFAEGGSRGLLCFLCFAAVWLLIACVELVVRRGWSFPEF